MVPMQRVLVVDDDADNRELIEECLRPNCLVTVAENGAEALDVLGRNRRKFDALVVDLDMPRMDGAELVRELQRREIDIPVLIISGRYDARWQARDVHAAFMSKPFEIESLTERVEQLARGA
jgi:CheY-like chemotaxis protein